MNLVFIHDHKFIKSKNGNIYSTGSFPKKWDRYLDSFESITVMARLNKTTCENKNTILSSHSKVKFILLKISTARTFHKNKLWKRP